MIAPAITDSDLAAVVLNYLGFRAAPFSMPKSSDSLPVDVRMEIRILSEIR